MQKYKAAAGVQYTGRIDTEITDITVFIIFSNALFLIIQTSAVYS